MTNKNVTAAIVTYNRVDLLKEALTAVLNQTDYLNHVIVVNNKSTDETADYLATVTDPRVIVYNSEENLGGAGGFNKAVRLFAEETQDDYVWLMDDDTIAEPDALKYLVDFITENDHVGFVNSVVRWGSRDGHPSWMNVPAPRAFTWQYHMHQENPGIEVVNSTFVSVLFSRKTVAMVGLPQKEYFIWGDDMEYTNRIADVNRGYTVLKSIVVHKSKENTMPGDIVREQDDSRLWRYNYEYRNRVLTARRVSKHELLRTVVNALRYDLRAVLFGGHVKYRWQKVKMIVSGTFRGIQFNPDIEYVAGLREYDVRSINKLLRARYLSDPQAIITLDQDIDFIENYTYEDFLNKTPEADKYIMQIKAAQEAAKNAATDQS